MVAEVVSRVSKSSNEGSFATFDEAGGKVGWQDRKATGTVRPDAFNQLKEVDCILLGGIETARISREELASLMVADCLDRRDRRLPPRLVFSSNGQGIAYAGSNPQFAAALDQADLVHADGMSVVLASKLLTDRPLPERVPTTDFFSRCR